MSNLISEEVLNEVREIQENRMSNQTAIEVLNIVREFIELQTSINTKLLENTFDINSAITAQQYLISKGLHNWDKRNTFSRRAANALRVGKQIEDLPMYKNNVLYYPSDIGYLEETLSQLLED
jgi:hypothetical protein